MHALFRLILTGLKQLGWTIYGRGHWNTNILKSFIWLLLHLTRRSQFIFNNVCRLWPRWWSPHESIRNVRVRVRAVRGVRVWEFSFSKIRITNFFLPMTDKLLRLWRTVSACKYNLSRIGYPKEILSSAVSPTQWCQKTPWFPTRKHDGKYLNLEYIMCLIQQYYNKDFNVPFIIG